MKKFWQLISKKDFIFGMIILVLVIVFSFKPSNKVRFSFQENEVDIKSTKYSMNIPYDLIDHIQLTQKPDMGEKVDGYTDNIIATGTWRNDTWGKYEACVECITDNCIEIYLTDGRIFVVSRRNNEETQRIFEEFQSYLQ